MKLLRPPNPLTGPLHCPATSPFPTATECWEASPKASPPFTTTRPARIASRRCLHGGAGRAHRARRWQGRHPWRRACANRRSSSMRATPAPPSACSPASWRRRLSPPASAATNRSRGRPMDRIIRPLTEMGAHIEGRQIPGRNGQFPAAHDPRASAARHRLHAAHGQRAGEKLRAAGGAVRRRATPLSASRSARAITPKSRSRNSAPTSKFISA